MKTVIEMAREAGFDPHDMSADFTCNLKDIERFAELVRADEREACAELCERMARRTEDIRSAALEMAAENIRARGQDPMPLFDDWPGGWK